MSTATSEVIGTTFQIGKVTYVVDKVEPVDTKFKAMTDAMVKSGKDAVIYYASKVLKSGKKSVQGGMFYRFTETGNFIKVL